MNVTECTICPHLATLSTEKGLVIIIIIITTDYTHVFYIKLEYGTINGH